MTRQLASFLLVLLTQPFLAWGARREFDFEITWDRVAPAGLSRPLLLVNGQSPGPLIEVDQDDWVVVRLHNNAALKSAIHFHGLEMHNSPWTDGVPGVTQRPVPPHSNFTYEFQATQYGSYWYHAHYLSQIENGLMGPIVIHPRPGDPKPFKFISQDKNAIKAMEYAEHKVQPLLISDVTRLHAHEKWLVTQAAGLEITCYDAFLFNGKGSVECLTQDEIETHVSPQQERLLRLAPGSQLTNKGCLPPNVMGRVGGPNAVFNTSAIPRRVFYDCQPTEGDIEVIQAPKSPIPGERWVAIDLIAATNFFTYAVSIDEHDMWIYAMDGSYVEPQKVQAAIMTNGDRYSVLVKTSKPGDFKIRVNSVTATQMLTGHALLSVDGTGISARAESKPHINIIGGPTSKGITYFDQTKAAPFPPEPIAEVADQTHVLTMHIDGASYLWALNGSRLMPNKLDDGPPVLFYPQPDVQNNVTITTRNNTWVDLVFIAAEIPMPPHPIHKHGTKMYGIGSGTGPFKWASVADAIKDQPNNFNLINPPRRDSFATIPAGKDITWTVMRYHVTNPGPWLLHCHIMNHMMGGMMMVIQDGIDAWPEVPVAYRDPKPEEV